MVHKDDEEALTERDWRRANRQLRRALVTRAYDAEKRLLLAISVLRDLLKEHAEIRRNIESLHGEVLREAMTILDSNEIQVAVEDLRVAFNECRDAWLLLPSFKRHELRDRKLKKQAKKMLEDNHVG